MATSAKRHLKYGGFEAPYSPTSASNDYMLYNPSATTTAATTAVAASSNNVDVLPGVKGGNSYATDGGCSSCGTSGGARRKRATKAAPKKATKATKAAPKKATKKTARNGGMGLELAPFMSALALLGARLLADKEVGIFNDKKAQSPHKSASSKKTSSSKK